MPWRIRRFRTRAAVLAGVLVIASGAACTVVSSLAPPATVPLAPAVGQSTSVGPSGPTAPAPGPGPRSVVPGPAAPAAGGSASDAQTTPSAAAGASARAAQASTARTAAQQAPATAGQASPAAAEDSAPDTSAQILDRMVIRTAQLTLEVGDIEHALAQVRQIATNAGGFVSASDTHVDSSSGTSHMIADLTLQIRSDSTDSVISDLRALGTVTAESSGSQDVTEEYVDLDSDLRNLQATESAILQLMDRATQIQDVLSLQRELTNVRGQIERIQGRKNYLQQRTDMATISVSLRLPGTSAANPAAPLAWDPLAAAQRGWQTSLALLRGAAEALIVALAFSWWLLAVAVGGAAVVLNRRRRSRRLTTPTDPT